MGSSSSKHNADEPSTSSSSSASARRNRSKGSRVFQSSCLGPPPGSDDSDNDEQAVDYLSKENRCNRQSGNRVISDRNQINAECCSKVRAQKPNETACKSSSTEIDEWGQSNLLDTVSRAGSTSQAFSTQSLSPSDRFLSRCSFFPGNSSFRLSKTTNIGSSRAHPTSSRSFTASDEEEELNLGRAPSRGSVSRTKSSRARDFLPACLINRSLSPQHQDHSSNCLDSNHIHSGFSYDSQDDQIVSALNVVRDADNPRVECHVNLQSLTNFTDMERMELRPADRRVGAREPVERNVRFSRTLSVGRLRDRVLRRSSFPDLTFSPLQQEREGRDAGQGDIAEGLDGEAGLLVSNENALMPTNSFYPSSGMSNSSFNSQNYGVETSRARETRYHDLLEHRSNFLERRRRIRSQVRALQRLGSRFENLSGHERACILSGQHRTGHCTCHISTRDPNSNDNTGARQSISRIVMLAEALFEVLDEIHQQSVVLSSRPSVSSIGSVPAPIDVVESLPVKSYRKLQKHLIEEAAQCYICLVEYEEGDAVRTLPCHHEFHTSCVDKWLKEIHRVCPLCRGDICKPESMLLEN